MPDLQDRVIESKKIPGAAKMEPVLKMTEISKDFSGVRVLDNVDFDLYEGEVHALLGENGAGKSTLIKIISGVYEKTAGRIEFDGEEIRFKSTAQAHKKGINTIFQELSIIPNIDIARNMFLGREEKATFLGGLSSKIYDKTAKHLEKVGLNLSPTTKVADIKLAHRQLIEISKAISQECRILIMDEPTSSLSDEEIENLFRIIADLKEAGVGIIYISHKLDEVINIADRVTVLRDGKQTGSLEKDQITESRILKMMVGRDIFLINKVEKTLGNPVLKIDGLTKDGVVDDITFTLRGGEVLGLFGLIGAGRTELVRMIFGADKIDEGEVYIGGRAASFRNPADAVSAGIGLVPEDRKEEGLFLNMDIAANISMASLKHFCQRLLINRRKQLKKSTDISRSLKIRSTSLQQSIRFLSGGNQQKCVLGRWLISAPKVLILDEPTRGIDVGAKHDVYQVIENLAETGVGIILVSSELPEILRLCDRVIVMHEGKSAGELSAAEMSEDLIIKYAFGGRN